VSLVMLLSRRWWRRMGTVAINLVLYAVLVVAYFFAVLQWLNEPLAQLFRRHLTQYALVSVALILGQGLLLDVVSSSLLSLGKWLSNRWGD
jgi:hypothetical protein